MAINLHYDGAPTFHEFGYDGHAALSSLIASSPYRSLEQAIASLALFSHPGTVKQTNCLPVLRVIRRAAMRGQIEMCGGISIGLDDNKAPTDVFMWCNGFRKRPRDVHFNHIYAASDDAEAYTCLANLCVTPSFLSKLTDTDLGVRAILQFRAFELFGWYPRGHLEPREPNGYKDLIWALTISPVDNVETQFLNALSRKPLDRTTQFANRLGHVFNGYTPKY